MSVITIDLLKNPDVAALAADKQPGDKVYGCFTVKSRDDQTLELRIAEMAGSKDELPDASETDDEAEADDNPTEEKAEPDQSPEGAEAEAPEPPYKKLARQMETQPTDS